MRRIQGHVKRGIKHDFAREKVLMTLYRHYNGLDSKTVRLELEEVLKEEGADVLLNDESFTLELWLELIEHAQQQCPAFFRLIDRIEQDMEFAEIRIEGFGLRSRFGERCHKAGQSLRVHAISPKK